MSLDLYALLSGGPVAPAAGDAVVGLRSGASAPLGLAAGPPTHATSVPSLASMQILLTDGTYITGTQLQAALGGTAAPTVTTNPSISGTAQVGQTLTVTDGAASGGATISARQWYWGDTGAAISGATGSTYVPVSGDVGHTIICKVTWSNGGSVVGTSAATAAVTAASTTTITFAGTAGAPTGNQVLTPWYAAPTGTARDGSGNMLVSTSAGTLGTFQGPGMADPNATGTFTLKPGAETNDLCMLARATGGTSNYSAYQANGNSDGSVNFYRSNNGVVTTLGTLPAGTIPSAPIKPAFRVSGTTGNPVLTVLVNGASVGSYTDTHTENGGPILSAGYFGVGANHNTSLSLHQFDVT